MNRTAKIASTVLALVAASILATVPAQARKHAKPVPSSDDDTGETAKAKPGKAESNKPVQVATFGDWGAYLAKGKGKTCYALAAPKDRKPDVKHDAAYVFIADRPAEKVHNEVSIIMGFPVKESAGASAKVGATSFDLVAKGSNAWIKNPADEAKFVEALKHSGKLIVKAAALRGPATTDTYVLTGVKPALERVTKECR